MPSIASTLEPLSILIADPHRHMGQILRQMLRMAGARIFHEATDGAQALDLITTRSVDIAIVGEELHLMDGIELTRHLRRFGAPGVRFLPVILTMDRPTRARVLEARDAGIRDVIAKPLSARILTDRVLRLSADVRPSPPQLPRLQPRPPIWDATVDVLI